jgi:photosystem II stability/assembly factor-like uncharacterized protein
VKGDFSRSTFRPHKHYRNVRLQQGRVQLDADWNEQADIQAHRDQTATRDMVGPTGAPVHEAGFALSVRNNELWIGAGRYYVDGLLCENEGDVDFEGQADLPGARLPADPSGTYLSYIDAWKRHITAVEDPSLREVALGGPDTTTREKMVWQVKLQPVVDNTEIRTFSSPDWAPRNTKSTGLLSARAKPGADSDGSASPGAGYRRLENQLYRVEIHEGGEPVGAPRSGALTAVQDIAGAEVQVVNDGRRWQAGEMVELFGGADSTAPSTLARIVAIDERPPSGTSASLRAVDFRDPDRPSAVGDDATILASEDGGANWALQKPPEGVSANFHGVYFSGRNGFAVGADATILATTDGGANWVQQDPPEGMTASLRAIFFSDPNRPRAVGDDATILASEDGGANWVEQRPPEGVSANLHGVYFSGRNGFAVGDDATILATTDGGASWVEQPPEGVSANLHGVYFSGSNAWAVGDDATILATRDGGANWAEQEPPQGVTHNLRAVHLVYSLVDSQSPPRGWAVGDGATILATTDGGANWAKQPPPLGVNVNLYGVRFSSSSGFAVGDDATILASKDDGTTWTQQTTQVLTLDKDISEIEPQPTLLRRVATFKFSRDNGTVLTRLEEINGDVITVSNPGRDATLGFVDGGWVELSDEERVLRGEPGILVQVASVEGNDLTVDRWPDDTPLTRIDFGTLPTVRRWDSERAIPVTTRSWLDLENGIEIQFAIDAQDNVVQGEVADEFHTGDYWTIPARGLIGDVEWPQGDPGSQNSTQPIFEARHGIEHHYCPLSLLELKDRTWSLVSDYRKLFPPVTELTGSGIRVAGVFLESTGQALGPELAVADLASGIRLVCETNIDLSLVNGKRLCSVTLDMPFPSNDQDRQIWGVNVVGVSSLTLSTDEESPDGKTILWKPSSNTRSWLEGILPRTMRTRFQQDRMLAHLTLRGSTFETWFSLVFERVTETKIGFIPNLEPADGRGYPFAGERVKGSLTQALSFAIDRKSLSEALPPGYSVDETLDFDPDQAKTLISLLRRDPKFDPRWLVLIQRRLFEDEERLFSLTNLLLGMLLKAGIEPIGGYHEVGDVGDTDNEKGVEDVRSYLSRFDFAPLVVIGDETFAENLSTEMPQQFNGDLLIYF